MQDLHDQYELPCADKIAYDTQKDAQAAATVARHWHGSKLYTYKCQYCALWHLATDYDK